MPAPRPGGNIEAPSLRSLSTGVGAADGGFGWTVQQAAAVLAVGDPLAKVLSGESVPSLPPCRPFTFVTRLLLAL